MITINQLPAEQALGPNDDLWILSETSGTLFHRLDWLLNFQLTGAVHHQAPALPKKVQELLSQCELPSFDFTELEKIPIWLVGSLSFLPCRWVLLAPIQNLDNEKLIQDWWRTLQSRIEAIKTTRVRLFLPESFPISKLKGLDGNPEVQYSLVAQDLSAESLKWI